MLVIYIKICIKIQFNQNDNFIKELKEFSPDYLVANITMPTFETDMMALYQLCTDGYAPFA